MLVREQKTPTSTAKIPQQRMPPASHQGEVPKRFDLPITLPQKPLARGKWHTLDLIGQQCHVAKSDDCDGSSRRVRCADAGSRFKVDSKSAAMVQGRILDGTCLRC